MSCFVDQNDSINRNKNHALIIHRIEYQMWLWGEIKRIQPMELTDWVTGTIPIELNNNDGWRSVLCFCVCVLCVVCGVCRYNAIRGTVRLIRLIIRLLIVNVFFFGRLYCFSKMNRYSWGDVIVVFDIFNRWYHPHAATSPVSIQIQWFILTFQSDTEFMMHRRIVIKIECKLNSIPRHRTHSIRRKWL